MSRTHSILRPSTVTDNPPFVPSPQWLSESPARPPSTASQPTLATPRIDRPHENTEPLPSQTDNLHRASSAAFNVDPGAPFLAALGTENAANVNQQPEGSPPMSSKVGRSLVGGFKRAVGTLRKGSLSSGRRQGAEGRPNYYNRENTDRPPAPPGSPFVLVQAGLPGEVQRHSAEFKGAHTRQNQETEIGFSGAPPRDSGYAHSDTQPVIPGLPEFPPINAQYAPSAHSQTPTPVAASQYAQGPGHLMSPTQLFSPVSAAPEYGSDYAQMDPPTPPPSDVSFNTYLSRAQRIVSAIAALPWVAERPTDDYYPERSRRRDEPKHAPQISWHAPDFARPSLALRPVADTASDAGTWEEWEQYEETKPAMLAITPRRGSQVNLGEEFGEPPPPDIGHTPRFREQSLYAATPKGSTRILPTPAQATTRLPVHPPLPTQQYPPLPQWPPLPQDPPNQPIAQPQPLYSSEFQKPPMLEPDGRLPPVSRPSSRGYALYDPPMPSPPSGKSRRTSVAPQSLRAPSEAPTSTRTRSRAASVAESTFSYTDPSPRAPSAPGSGASRHSKHSSVHRPSTHGSHHSTSNYQPSEHGSARQRSTYQPPIDGGYPLSKHSSRYAPSDINREMQDMYINSAGSAERSVAASQLSARSSRRSNDPGRSPYQVDNGYPYPTHHEPSVRQGDNFQDSPARYAQGYAQSGTPKGKGKEKARSQAGSVDAHSSPRSAVWGAENVWTGSNQARGQHPSQLDQQWEMYSKEETGYVSYAEARARGYYSHETRDAGSARSVRSSVSGRA